MIAWAEALPAIGTFLAGPVGTLTGAGVQWLATQLGASEKTVDGIKQTLDGMTPEQVLEARKIDIDFQKFCLDNQIKLQLAQIAVNQEEAKSSNLFLAGWRPACGWGCAFAFSYVAIAEPIARFVAQVMLGYKGPFPVIDTTLTMQLLGVC